MMEMLVKRLCKDDSTKTKPSQVPAAEWQSIIDQLNPDSFQKAFEQAGGQVTGEYTVEMLSQMPPEKLRGIISEQQNRLENCDEPILQTVEQLQELSSADLDTAFQSRTSSYGQEERRKAMVSPFQLEQNQLPPVTQLFKERDVEFGDWTSDTRHFLHGSPYIEAPKSAFNDLILQLRDMNLGAEWNRNTGKDQNDQENDVCMPLIDPEFLVQYWKLMAELRGKEIFNVKFDFPPEVGILHSAAPHFSLKPTTTFADVSGKFPQNHDRLLISMAEAEQWLKFGNAVISLNNLVFVATKLLTWRIEDVATPLAQDRKEERVLCAIIREATKLMNDMQQKSNIIAMCAMRRDSMLRADYDPVAHPVTFTSPIPTNGPFNKTLDAEQLTQWVDKWGQRMEDRLEEENRRSDRVRCSRDLWFAKRKEELQEKRFQQYLANPSTNPSEVSSPDRFDAALLQQADVSSAKNRLRHASA